MTIQVPRRTKSRCQFHIKEDNTPTDQPRLLHLLGIFDFLIDDRPPQTTRIVLTNFGSLEGHQTHPLIQLEGIATIAKFGEGMKRSSDSYVILVRLFHVPLTSVQNDFVSSYSFAL